MWAPDDRFPQSDAAVIDVGSNSVRLVLYRLEGRAVWTVFNEKVLAGLGRDLATTGRLSKEGAEQAMAALVRFGALLEAERPTQVFAVATAAVREAKDGRDFCRRVERETGLTLRILTGEEEARFAAMGVVAGAPAAGGLVGDLGGASLELVRLDDGGPAQGVTLPLGPFSLGQDFDRKDARETVAEALEPIADAYASETLNAVGGAWRSLAILHMRMTDYPLEIVHQYELSRREALETARIIARQSKSSLDRIEGISSRRLETLPHAAVVLEGLIQHLGVQKVVMSAYGLREGLIYEAMTPRLRARDPLIEGCEALGERQGVAGGLGMALETWVSPAFASLEPLFGAREGVLVAAACRLADLGARLHPDHRADLIFDQVLRAPIAGMDHAERVFLACAAFARHTAANTVRAPDLVGRLLSDERYQRARALGAAIRLACDLSGRNAALLRRSRLEFKGDAVVLTADHGWGERLMGEQTVRRAATLAAVLDRELKVTTARTPRKIAAAE